MDDSLEPYGAKQTGWSRTWSSLWNPRAASLYSIRNIKVWQVIFKKDGNLRSQSRAGVTGSPGGIMAIFVARTLLQ